MGPNNVGCFPLTPFRGIAVAICAVLAAYSGAARASLVGDDVTVGHYGPDSSIELTGATPPKTFSVATGASDVYTFYNSHPFGYRVNIEAASILISFDYLASGTAGSWPDTYQSCSFTPPFACSVVNYTFNGPGVSGINDSSGNPLQGVLVDTNMAGWNSSRLTFAGDYVRFDWKGLPFTNETFLTATLEFGPPVGAIPEPSTYALMLAGLAGVGVVSRRRKT